MSTISPTSVTLDPLATQTFSQSGVSSPVWTLDGIGTLNQSGLYTAPSGGGSALVRVHNPFWNYVNSSYFTANADDTLTKNTATAGYYAQAKSNALLNAVGDYVEFRAARLHPYWTGVENDAGTHRVVYSSTNNPNFLRVYHPSGNADFAISGWAADDLIRMEIIAGGSIQVSHNGTVVHTTAHSYIGSNLRFIQDGDLSNGVVVKVPLMVVATGYVEVSATVIVSPPLPYGFAQEGTELFCEANLLTASNGASISSFTDQSLNFRHLVAASSQPTFQTAVVNGKSAIRWSGTSNPLAVTAAFTLRCGWVVAKFDGTSFSAYQGLLTDLTSQVILTSDTAGTNFFDYGYLLFEFRSNDRLYPDSAAPAPLGAFKLLFFRFWQPLTVSGIRLGQDRDFTARKFDGDVALVVLTSRNFSEEEIRARSVSIAAAYGLTLADVYPYQSDRRGYGESFVQQVNVYDPPEGTRVAEVVNDRKRTLQLEFSSRRQAEIDAMRTFHAAHFPEVPCIYRNYNLVPPVDIEGYIDSPYSLEGAINNFNYGFGFREK